MGNCLELSATFCSNFLNSEYYHENTSRVELVKTSARSELAGAHAFSILDRSYNSDLNDPTTWGEQTQIVDTWNNETLTVSELLAGQTPAAKHIKSELGKLEIICNITSTGNLQSQEDLPQRSNMHSL